MNYSSRYQPKRYPATLSRLRVPAILAPMFQITSPDMVVAAAKAGIVGAIPSLNARTTEHLELCLQTITTRIAAEGEQLRGSWAVNLVAHSTNQRLEPDLDLVIKYKTPIVITALGSPKRVVERVHEYGGLVIADVNSESFARKAADTGVDGLLLVACGAGGHTGQMNPFAFVEAVREFWDGLLILAGSISTGRALRAAVTLGADIGSIGTRFVATRESLAVPEYKRMVIDAKFDDIVCTNSFTGAWANMLRPSISRAGFDPDNLTPGRPLNVSDDPHSSARPWKDIWGAGHGVGVVRNEETVADVVDLLVAEYNAAAS